MVKYFTECLCHNAFSDFVRQGVNLTNGTETLNKLLVLFEKKRHERHTVYFNLNLIGGQVLWERK